MGPGGWSFIRLFKKGGGEGEERKEETRGEGDDLFPVSFLYLKVLAELVRF